MIGKGLLGGETVVVDAKDEAFSIRIEKGQKSPLRGITKTT